MIEYILIVSACIGVAVFIISKMADAQDEEKHEMVKTSLEIEMEERERQSNSVPKSWSKKNIFDDKEISEAIDEAIKQKKRFYD